jgi:hypothetical protein
VETVGNPSIENDPERVILVGLDALAGVSVDLTFVRVDELASLHGLEGLTAVSGRLTLLQLNQLAGVSGLGGLRSAGSVRISENASLTSMGGLSALGSVSGRLIVFLNPKLAQCELSALSARASTSCSCEEDALPPEQCTPGCTGSGPHRSCNSCSGSAYCSCTGGCACTGNDNSVTICDPG